MQLKFILLLFVSFVSFAIEVGEEVELTQYMNARYSADFRKTTKNVMGTLNKGNKGVVKEVRKFLSGNSGFLLEVKDGAMSGQNVWVYYDVNSPSLTLTDSAAAPTTSPDEATGATAIRDIPAVREPATGPGVAMSDSDRALADLARVNRDGTSADCHLCNDRSAIRFSSSVSAAGDVTASFSCSYAGKYGAMPGTIDLIIENNVVKRLEANIDGCSISLANFPQIFFNNKNIVLKHSNGCTVSLNRYNRSTSGQPVLNFGVVPTRECVQLCPRVQRKFWQAELNPNSRTCY